MRVQRNFCEPSLSNKVAPISKKKRLSFQTASSRKAATYSPTIMAVPSAQIGLTSLFGMGRGEPYCYNHLKFLRNLIVILLTKLKEFYISRKKNLLPKLTGYQYYSALTLLPLHLQPINVVIFHDPLKKSHLVAGFALICFQRLSHPDVATQRCSWRNN